MLVRTQTILAYLYCHYITHTFPQTSSKSLSRKSIQFWALLKTWSYRLTLQVKPTQVTMQLLLKTTQIPTSLQMQVILSQAINRWNWKKARLVSIPLRPALNKYDFIFNITHYLIIIHIIWQLSHQALKYYYVV